MTIGDLRLVVLTWTSACDMIDQSIERCYINLKTKRFYIYHNICLNAFCSYPSHHPFVLIAITTFIILSCPHSSSMI
jgi:hypothetical protein